ncbi:MAG: bis(5'-nucleosyl)-tetraphosphatase (symmetrical) YqeK [Elusimicrobiota bacterium]
MDEKIILKKLKKMMPDNRYKHSLKTASMAGKLAKHFSLHPGKARLAGLLHDCAKGMSVEEMVKFYRQQKKNFTDGERIVATNPVLLHSQISACLAGRKFGVKDKEVLRAIALHTTADRKMSVLDKIIYLADMLSPERRYAERKNIQQAAFQNLDKALLLGVVAKIKHVLSKKQSLYQKTVEAYNKLVEDKGGTHTQNKH